MAWCIWVQAVTSILTTATVRPRPWLRSSSCAPEDDELLRGPRHRDVPVDGSLDTFAEILRIDDDDQVELEALRQFGGQRPDPRRGGERGVADDAGDPVGVRGER